MLSLGLLFFSLVEIMVPRAPQAVVGGGELSPGGTRCWATAGEGKATKRRHRLGKLRPGERDVPTASPAHCDPAKQSGWRHPHTPNGGRKGLGKEGGAGLV